MKRLIIAILLVLAVFPLGAVSDFKKVRVNADVIDSINKPQVKSEIKTGGWIWIGVIIVTGITFGYLAITTHKQPYNN